jgi:ProQ/FINO family
MPKKNAATRDVTALDEAFDIATNATRAPTDTPRHQAKNNWYRHRQLMLDMLPATLGCAPDDVPVVFLNLHWPRTLKIGIDADLRARFPQADTAKMRCWLKFWTRAPAYLKRLATGAHRHDIDGNDAGLIDAKHARHARKLLGSTKTAAPPDPTPPPKPPKVRTRPVLSLPARAAMQ